MESGRSAGLRELLMNNLVIVPEYGHFVQKQLSVWFSLPGSNRRNQNRTTRITDQCKIVYICGLNRILFQAFES